METILTFILPLLSAPALALLLLFFAPDKVEKWLALILKWLAHFMRAAHKHYVKHDLQGRVNDFVASLKGKLPSLPSEKLRIEWIDPNTSRKAFIEGDHVVIRLRREDPEDQNFIHASYMFVSESLLRKPKRYLAPAQRDGIDLFVCTKLLEAERPSVLSFFLEQYLHPATEERKSRTAIYVDDFAILDKSGLFFQVFLQELEYLGDKVFGRRRDDLVIKEVDSFVEFLKPIAARRVGEESDLEFKGEYCRFALVIIGKPEKLLTSIEPYIGYIRKALLPANVETIYILARPENEAKIKSICSRFESTHECVRAVKYTKLFRYRYSEVTGLQYLAVLRRRGTPIIQASR